MAPAHVGVEGNEVADIWAKVAAEYDTNVSNRGFLMEASLLHTL